MLVDHIAVLADRREQVPFSKAIAYRKCGTNARVFSKILGYWNKNNIRHRNRVRQYGRRENMESTAGKKNDVPTA